MVHDLPLAGLLFEDVCGGERAHPVVRAHFLDARRESPVVAGVHARLLDVDFQTGTWRQTRKHDVPRLRHALGAADARRARMQTLHVVPCTPARSHLDRVAGAERLVEALVGVRDRGARGAPHVIQQVPVHRGVLEIFRLDRGVHQRLRVAHRALALGVAGGGIVGRIRGRSARGGGGPPRGRATAHPAGRSRTSAGAAARDDARGDERRGVGRGHGCERARARVSHDSSHPTWQL